MIKRLKQISPGPLRLLIVGSFLLLLVALLFALYSSTPENKEHYLIRGEWAYLINGEYVLVSKYDSYRPFFIALFATAIYLIYWLVARIVLWVADGFKQPR